MLAPSKSSARKGELTRQDLMSAARVVFARSGYLGAETGHIAKEAGKSSGVFYIYFDNKDDLLKTLVEAFQTELHALLVRPFNPPEAVGEVLSTLWNVYKKHAGTFIALTEASSTSRDFAEMAATLRTYGLRDLSNMIRERQKAGFCARLDADIAGAALDTMINYCLYEWLARGTANFQDELQERAAMQNLVDIIRAAMELDR